MFQIIIKLIGTLLVLFGVILVYDARIITKRFFGFGDQNEASLRTKTTWLCNCYYRRSNIIF